jgi:N-acetyl-1-D-myo-inositol-2-amino-2-deoxy-alpha-D-glucopyranoside deacetylase
VCLITCTDGEEGEIAEVPELGPSDAIKPRLGEIRRGELVEACRRLGAIDLRMLGYHDSGMDGTEANDAAHAFVRQDLDGVVDRIVSVLEEIRPQAVVTYDENGGYGHPDHIHAHRAAVAAARRCGVPKIYYAVFPRSLMRTAQALFGEAFFSDEDIEVIGTDDDLITTTVDVTSYVPHKFAALEAHRTQFGTTKPFLELPDDLRQMGMGTEFYVLVGGTDGAQETDLFA